MNPPSPAPPSLSFNPTASFPFKVVGCSILALLGVYYLARGKQNGEAGSMVIGAALIIVSFLIF